MAARYFSYVIIGGGLAGASAISAIRERDRSGAMLLLGRERHEPYDRPPLTKKLWFGKKQLEEIFLQPHHFYEEHGVELRLGVEVTSIDPAAKTVTDSTGCCYAFGKLLLATGGIPRRPQLAGNDLAGICYYRTLDDYQRLREAAGAGRRVVIVGGGFIGSELAAALSVNRFRVTMIYPDPYLVARVFPASLGQALEERYRRREIEILHEDVPVAFRGRPGGYAVETRGGRLLECELLVVGIGIRPATELAERAGLQVGDGLVVNARLQSSHPEIYAAGDLAFFPSQALGKLTRVEHWDNALQQGQLAGRNMVGAAEPYTHLPYFFSDLFEFGYEAVGEVSSALETFADWQQENDTGVIYYLREGRVRGVMLCNTWGKLDAARELIRRREPLAREELRGAIR